MAAVFDIFAMDTDIHTFKSGIVGLTEDDEEEDEDEHSTEDIFGSIGERQHRVSTQQHQVSNHKLVSNETHLDYDDLVVAYENVKIDEHQHRVSAPQHQVSAPQHRVSAPQHQVSNHQQVSNETHLDFEDLLGAYANDTAVKMDERQHRVSNQHPQVSNQHPVLNQHKVSNKTHLDFEDLLGAYENITPVKRDERQNNPSNQLQKSDHQVSNDTHLDFDDPLIMSPGCLDDDTAATTTGNATVPLFDLDGHVENVVKITGCDQEAGSRVVPNNCEDDDILDLFSSFHQDERDDYYHHPQQQSMDYLGGAGLLSTTQGLGDIDDMMVPYFEPPNPGLELDCDGKGSENRNSHDLIDLSLKDHHHTLEEVMLDEEDQGKKINGSHDNLCNGMRMLDIGDGCYDTGADCKMLELADNDNVDVPEEDIDCDSRNLKNVCGDDFDDKGIANLFDFGEREQSVGTEECKLPDDFIVVDVPEFDLEAPDLAIDTSELNFDPEEFPIAQSPPEFAVDTPQFLVETATLHSDSPAFAVKTSGCTDDMPEQEQTLHDDDHTSMDDGNLKDVVQINFEEPKYKIGNRESGADFPHYNADFISYFSDESDMMNNDGAKSATLTLDQQRLTLTPNQKMLNFDSADEQDAPCRSQSSSSSQDSDESDDASYDLSGDVHYSRRAEVTESEDSCRSELTTDPSDVVDGQDEYYMGSDASTCAGISEMEEEGEEDDDDDEEEVMSEDDNSLDETFCLKDGEQTDHDNAGNSDDVAGGYDDTMDDTYNVLSLQVPPTRYNVKYRNKTKEMRKPEIGAKMDRDDASDDVTSCAKDDRGVDVAETDGVSEERGEKANQKMSDRDGASYNVLMVQVPNGYKFKYRSKMVFSTYKFKYF